MNLINRYSFLIALAFVAVISACTKEYASISEEDDTNIQAYISANNLSMQKFDTTGAYYSVVSEGKGPDLDYTQQILLIFTVKSLDGKYTSQDTFANHHAGLFRAHCDIYDEPLNKTTLVIAWLSKRIVN